MWCYAILIADTQFILTIFKYYPMPDSEQDASTELKDLEEKLDTLIERYDSISTENNSLKTRQDELVKEKARLLEKTTIARTRVEAMISRLKSMEHGS